MARTKPKFRINDVVYLESSAKTGRLESYKVSGIQFLGTRNWVYQFIIDQRPPAEATVGDRVDLKEGRELYFSEAELLTACEAMSIVIDTLERTIKKFSIIRDSKCDGVITGPSDVTPRSGEVLDPKYDIDEYVYVKVSAKIGFLESHKVTSIHRRPDSNEWIYELDVHGDRRVRDQFGNLDFKILNYQRGIWPPHQFFFLESELTSECTALDLSLEHYERELIKILQKFATVCE